MVDWRRGPRFGGGLVVRRRASSLWGVARYVLLAAAILAAAILAAIREPAAMNAGGSSAGLVWLGLGVVGSVLLLLVGVVRRR